MCLNYCDKRWSKWNSLVLAFSHAANGSAGLKDFLTNVINFHNVVLQRYDNFSISFTDMDNIIL